MTFEDVDKWWESIPMPERCATRTHSINEPSHFVRMAWNAARESMQEDMEDLKSWCQCLEFYGSTKLMLEDQAAHVKKLKTENTALKKQLSEAREVIEFYGFLPFWSRSGGICLDDREESGNRGGKRARTYLEKYPKGEE